MLDVNFTTQVVEQKEVENQLGGKYFRVIFEPLEPGYGNTLGNSLRRVLLNSIEGAAITRIKVDGATHQFTTLKGMSEDMVDFSLNMKQVRLSLENQETAVLKLSVQNKDEVYASDIQVPSGVKIANPELLIARLSGSESKLEAELTAEKGIGYKLADINADLKLGEIALDALFSPIIKVAYRVEATRVGRRTDYDRLIMEIWTDGTIDATTAVSQASEVLMKHFQQILDPQEIEVEEPVVEEAPADNETMSLTVEELELPARIANALRKGGYKTVKDLTNATTDEIAKVKNLGEKSVDFVQEALDKKGVSLKEA